MSSNVKDTITALEAQLAALKEKRRAEVSEQIRALQRAQAELEAEIGGPIAKSTGQPKRRGGPKPGQPTTKQRIVAVITNAKAAVSRGEIIAAVDNDGYSRCPTNVDGLLGRLVDEGAIRVTGTRGSYRYSLPQPAFNGNGAPLYSRHF